MTDFVETEDRTTFDMAHPALSLTADDGEQIELPQERLPRLLGWTVLLQPWQAPKKTKGGLFLPDTVADANEYMTYVFRVVALGPLAFTHPKLRGGAKRRAQESLSAQDAQLWLSAAAKNSTIELWDAQREWEETEFAPGVVPPEPGQWVIVRKFAGLNLNFEGASLKLCNDDDILAVLPKGPAGWKAYV